MAKVRLDALLTERGLFQSRSRAAASVLAGEVRLPGGEAARKPGQLVANDVELEVVGPPPYVSRGGIKLANALDATGVDPAGAGRSTSAPPPVASPIACCSAGPSTSSPTTSPTASCTGACATTRA